MEVKAEWKWGSLNLSLNLNPHEAGELSQYPTKAPETRSFPMDRHPPRIGVTHPQTIVLARSSPP